LEGIRKRGRARLEVECLDCGLRRGVTGLTTSQVGECPACGYLGWALPDTIDPLEREVRHAALSFLLLEQRRRALSEQKRRSRTLFVGGANSS
jgi:hypothetical protein